MEKYHSSVRRRFRIPLLDKAQHKVEPKKEQSIDAPFSGLPRACPR
jgi:hypothetical protein